MKILGWLLFVLWTLCPVPSHADPISIGIDLQEYPELVLVPDSPVYYAPQVEENFFFYDGEYWLYQDDNWYRSSWYDGPWWQVDPEDVPEFVLRVPVRFYKQPPIYFFIWWSEEPPHWGEHWGHEWERHRHGWDKWDHRVHHKPAPLPDYQKEYSGERYPRHVEQQHELHQKYYRYQSSDPIVLQHRPQPTVQRPQAQQQNRRTSGESSSMQQGNQRATPHQQSNGPAARIPSRQTESPESARQGQPAVREYRHEFQPDSARHEQHTQSSQGREERPPESEAARESRRGQERGGER